MNGWIVLVVLGAVVAWLGSLYFWPFAPCAKCKGTGRNRGSTSKRYGECRRCKGGGRRQRLGSRAVHRGAVSLHERARKRRERRP